MFVIPTRRRRRRREIKTRGEQLFECSSAGRRKYRDVLYFYFSPSAVADVFEKNEKKNKKRLCLQVNKHPPPNKGKALGQNIRQAPLSNKRLTLLPHPLNFLNTVKLIKPSSSEIFLECDCVAQKRPIRLDKTKLQCSPCVLDFQCNSSCFPTNFPEIIQLL